MPAARVAMIGVTYYPMFVFTAQPYGTAPWGAGIVRSAP
jgi:hypothetical protein